MKIHVALIFFILQSYVCYSQIEENYQIKANRIIERLISDRQFPSFITSNDDAFPPPEHMHTYTYLTTRNSNQFSIDSVIINLLVDDSLMTLEFDEEHLVNGIIIQGWHYTMYDGRLTLAFSSVPLENSVPAKSDTISNSIIFPENTHRTLEFYDEMSNETDIIEAYSVYIPKLKLSIDELYEKLFH